MNIFVSDLHSAIVVRFISGIAAAPMSTLGFSAVVRVDKDAPAPATGHAVPVAAPG
ncbi:hypothetical protein MZK49_01275 [Ensifer sesbaniae]|jgi:hypothetical protein|nr:hypothetical protein [Ensifer sesbaniae]